MIVGVLVLAALAHATAASSARDWVAGVEKKIDTLVHEQGEPPLRPQEPPVGIDFNCPVQTSPSVPTSVHQLRPSDIKVVGAIGDSMTAAFGAEATSILNLSGEWRGDSWTMGGNDDVSTRSTLPNILRQFNPSLYGFSVGKGNQDSAAAFFNVAVSGAIALDMPGQAEVLIGRMAASEAINFNEDWKVINLWIGGNDLCNICNNNPDNLPENYIAYIDDALTTIIQQIPRVYINLVNIIDVSRLAEIDVGACRTYHGIVCGCSTKGEAELALISQTAQRYQELIVSLAAQPRFHSDNFTVEVQPFFIDTQPPTLPDGTVDVSYFAPDCFHFSVKGHNTAGPALWNNMLQAPGSKSLTWNVNPTLMCPSAEAPYLCTSTNNCGRTSAHPKADE